MTTYDESPVQPNGMFVCPPPPKSGLSLETRLSVGFGYVIARRDDVEVWRGDNWQKKLKSVERQARRDPGHWTVEFYGALSGATYERRGRDEWVLIAQNKGFA